jgi:hypothetical protein
MGGLVFQVQQNLVSQNSRRDHFPFLSQRADFPEYGFDPIDRNHGIQARSERALIENAIDGQWSGVLNSAGEVPFACNGYDKVGTGLDHYSARDGPSGGNRHLHTVFFGKPEELLYGAFAAALAVFHPVSDLHLAVFVLQTMRHKEQNGMRRPSVATPRKNKFVINRYERMLDLFAPETRQSAYADQDRQEEPDRETPQFQRKRDIVAQRSKNCHYQREVDRDPGKTVIWDSVEQNQGRCGNDSEKHEKGDYYPFFRTGYRLGEIWQNFPLKWLVLFFHVPHSRNEPTGMGLPRTNSHARMRRWPSV